MSNDFGGIVGGILAQFVYIASNLRVSIYAVRTDQVGSEIGCSIS